MTTPVIIDVESDSDKENEAPEEVVTGHTASFEANRSGETLEPFNLKLQRLFVENHPSRYGVPGLNPMFGKCSLYQPRIKYLPFSSVQRLVSYRPAAGKRARTWEPTWAAPCHTTTDG